MVVVVAERGEERRRSYREAHEGEGNTSIRGEATVQRRVG